MDIERRSNLGPVTFNIIGANPLETFQIWLGAILNPLKLMAQNLI
jgi:hypothetical protein